MKRKNKKNNNTLHPNHHWSNINIYLTTHINDIMNATNEYNIQTELITDMHIQTELITEMHIYNEYAQIHNFFLTSWN
jgi:hypothetical protein